MLEKFRPFVLCPCGVQCNCKLYKEQNCIMQFLKGLNDQYSVVCSQILLMDPLPPINRAYALILQQERQLLSETSEVFKILSIGTSSSNTNTIFNGNSGSIIERGLGRGSSLKDSLMGGRFVALVEGIARQLKHSRNMASTLPPRSRSLKVPM